MIAHVTKNDNRLTSNLANLAGDATRLEEASKAAIAAYEATQQRIVGIVRQLAEIEKRPLASNRERYTYLLRQHQMMVDALPDIEANLYAIRDASYHARKLVETVAGPCRGLAAAAVPGTF